MREVASTRCASCGRPIDEPGHDHEVALRVGQDHGRVVLQAGSMPFWIAMQPADAIGLADLLRRWAVRATHETVQ